MGMTLSQTNLELSVEEVHRGRPFAVVWTISDGRVENGGPGLVQDRAVDVGARVRTGGGGGRNDVGDDGDDDNVDRRGLAVETSNDPPRGEEAQQRRRRRLAVDQQNARVAQSAQHRQGPSGLGLWIRQETPDRDRECLSRNGPSSSWSRLHPHRMKASLCHAWDFDFGMQFKETKQRTKNFFSGTLGFNVAQCWRSIRFGSHSGSGRSLQIVF